MPTFFRPDYLEITAASGDGTQALNTSGGNCISVGIIAPAANAVFDIAVIDSDGFALWGRTGLTGNNTIAASFMKIGRGTVEIENATVDGLYKVKLWYVPPS